MQRICYEVQLRCAAQGTRLAEQRERLEMQQQKLRERARRLSLSAEDDEIERIVRALLDTAGSA